MSKQEIIIRFAGDICFTPDIVSHLEANPSHQLFQAIEKRDNELLIGNLECVLAEEGESIVGKFACLKAPPKLIQQLEKFDALALANNHISDFGHDATLQTINTVEEAGIKTFGYGNNLPDSLKPLVLERKGIKVGILNFSCLSTNGQNYATINEPGVAPLAMELLKETIPAARKECDVLFLFLHWGLEHKHELVLDQMRIARYAASLGVNAIVGCHGHVLQPLETVWEVPVVYGIGNCVFGDIPYKFADAKGQIQEGVKQLERKHKESMIPCFKVVKHGDDVRVSWCDEQYWKFDQMELKSINKSDLVFDPRSSKEVLAANETFFKDALKSEAEIAYRAEFGGSYFGYYYDCPTVGPIGKAEKMDRFVKEKWGNIYGKFRS